MKFFTQYYMSKGYNPEDILEFNPSSAPAVDRDHVLYKTVDLFLEEHFKPKWVGLPLLLSLSGGPDSMSMLYIFGDLRTKYGYTLAAGHINYNNREDTEHEQVFAESQCSDLSVEVRTHKMSVRRADVPRDTYETMTTSERFAFYVEFKRELGAPVVIYGHHSGDIAENVLTNFMRGRNVHDLAVMNETGLKHNVTIWRPMLSKRAPVQIWKTHVFDFLHSSNIPYLKDTTPDSTKRGKMRCKAFPALMDTFGDDVQARLVSMARMAEEWGEIIQTEVIRSFISKNVKLDWNLTTYPRWFKISNWSSLRDKKLIVVQEILGQLMTSMNRSRLSNKTVKMIHDRICERVRTNKIKPFERINPGEGLHGALTPTHLIISTEPITAPESKSAARRRLKAEAKTKAEAEN